jgi:uncharacterized cupredoxin-like copper-binding protein
LTGQIKALVAVAVLALSLTAVAGCGGSNNDNNASTTSTTSTTNTATTNTATKPSGAAASTLTVDADPSGALKFTKSKLSAKAGNVTINMDNPSPVPHAIGIKGSGVPTVDGNTVNKGGVSTVKANLKSGSYEFYCPVDGHEAAGMKGTLTVK